MTGFRFFNLNLESFLFNVSQNAILHERLYELSFRPMDLSTIKKNIENGVRNDKFMVKQKGYSFLCSLFFVAIPFFELYSSHKMIARYEAI